MATSESFDGEGLTHRLQDAVRAHDALTLDELVSDDLLFASGRSLGRMGKQGFIAGALAIEWRSFDVGAFRALEMSTVGVVDYELSQDAVAGGQPLPTRWVVTDVWHRSARHGWQLVARHPEPAATQP